MRSKKTALKDTTKEEKLKINKTTERKTVLPQNQGVSAFSEEDNTVKVNKTEKSRQTGYSRNAIIAVSALAYLVFFLPFIFCKKEPYARFHLNQSCVMWIFYALLYLIFAFIPDVNIIAIPIIITFHLCEIVIGISYALRGKAKPLPIIGRIKLIKYE